MSFYVQDTGWLITTVNPPTISSFTACGWYYPVVNTSEACIFSICSNVNGNVDAYLDWSHTGIQVGNLALGSYINGGDSNNVGLARPPLKQWVFWFVRASGTGAGQLEGGYYSRGVWVTASTTLGAGATSAGATINFGNCDPYYTSFNLNGFIGPQYLFNAPLNNASIRRQALQLTPVAPGSFYPINNSTMKESLRDLGSNRHLTLQSTALINDSSPFSRAKSRLISDFKIAPQYTYSYPNADVYNDGWERVG